METKENRVPTHVSIIMDGNGRWAQERGLRRVEGHFEGVASAHACAEEAVRMGVKYLSIFAFSEENWGRPQDEVDTLMKLMASAMEKEVATMMENKVRFLVLGNRERLGLGLRTAIESLEEMTAANDAMTLIVFLSYSGKWDIMQAAKKMAVQMEKNPGMEPSFEDFDSYLVTAGIPDPDLVIRTSGEKRISNYLLWQTAYSEFLFVDKLWPDFREADFRAALEEFSKRDRRFGKVK